MIADYSSIIVMYFLSGRPIIYCDGNLNLSGVYKQLYNVMYIAKSWEDVRGLTEKLLKGIDPMKEERKKLSAQIAEKHRNSSKKIVDRICEDYKN
jgi:RNA-binding protein YhbY